MNGGFEAVEEVVEQSAVSGSGYSDLGTINTPGSTGGTAYYEYDAGALTARYVRVGARH